MFRASAHVLRWMGRRWHLAISLSATRAGHFAAQARCSWADATASGAAFTPTEPSRPESGTETACATDHLSCTEPMADSKRAITGDAACSTGRNDSTAPPEDLSSNRSTQEAARTDGCGATRLMATGFFDHSSATVRKWAAPKSGHPSARSGPRAVSARTKRPTQNQSIALNSTFTTSISSSPLGERKSTASPSRACSSACASGEIQLILRSRAFASSIPTIE